MEKDFDRWNRAKKSANQRGSEDIYFREREIWWCMLGINIGFEQDGKGALSQRPVLILKKFNQYVMVVVPLSMRLKDNPFYLSFIAPDGVRRSAIISQIRLIDIRRLTEKVCTVEENTYDAIKKAVRRLFA